MASETWAPVKGKDREYWKPEKIGDERIGTLLRGEAGEYKGKVTLQYVLDVEGKETYTPDHAVLKAKLLSVEAGSRVKIVYRGTGEKKKKGQNAAELYDVYVSDAPRQAAITEIPTADPQKPQAEKIKEILADVRLYCKLDHIIPEDKLKKLCGDEATFKHLRDAGLVVMSTWDKVEGWRAT